MAIAAHGSGTPSTPHARDMEWLQQQSSHFWDPVTVLSSCAQEYPHHQRVRADERTDWCEFSHPRTLPRSNAEIPGFRGSKAIKDVPVTGIVIAIAELSIGLDEEA